MKHSIRRIAALLLVLSMALGMLQVAAFAQEEDTGALPFTDVSENAWYYEGVYYAYEHELMNGMTATTFSPNAPLTRAMLVKILYNLDGCPTVSGSCTFVDVPDGRFYSVPALWAQKNGIVKGKDSTHFAPNDLITREELVTIQYRYAVYSSRDTSADTSLEEFADSGRVSNFAQSAMRWAVGAEVIYGKSAEKLDPKGKATRAEIAVIMMRFVENLADVSDEDGDGVPAWLEAYFGSSDTAVDTDGDGISDYIEIYEIGSDPIVADGDTDMDDDGLSNADEVNVYHTSPVKPDTDLDGLTDYEEIFVYSTDPLKADTDGDGIWDGDEVKLGLNPLGQTDISGVTQPLSMERVDEVLRTGDAAVCAVTGCSGNVLDRTVRLFEAQDEALRNNDAVIGSGIAVEMECPATLTVCFAVGEVAPSVVPVELNEYGWSVLTKTYQDGVISAQIDHSGTYCVVDLERLLSYLGVDTDACYQAVTNPSAGEQELINPAGDRILLDDFQYVEEPAKRGLGGQMEAGESDVTELVKACLLARGVSQEALDSYFTEENAVRLTVRTYRSTSAKLDSDFDGISDARDKTPKDNTFSGIFEANNITSKAEYTFDYRDFFNSPKKFSRNLCTTSLLFSSFIYSEGGFSYDSKLTYDGGSVTATRNIEDLLAVHGMQDTVDYSLTVKEYGDDDISEVGLGHHTVTYNGETRQVVAVIVRGTNGTIEEWSSNFDIGDKSKFKKNADWTDSKNHKGFDVTSNRILHYLEDYTAKYGLNGNNTVYWVTGHSRGAAIANLLSAKLIDNGKTVYAYTFAAPNTTTSTSVKNSKYQGIFNLVNEDDFVPCVPMSAWGFSRYGRTATIDMTSSMENEWHSLTGESWYNQMSKKNLNGLVDKLAGVCDGWDLCYKFTCSCHGGKDKDLTQTGLTSSNVKKIPERALKYCKKTSYKTWGLTRYKVCQVPGYFMQILAEITAANGLGQQVSAITSYKLADRFESARNKLVSAAVIGGIAHPHLCHTYFLLTQHVSASNFK